MVKQESESYHHFGSISSSVESSFALPSPKKRRTMAPTAAGDEPNLLKPEWLKEMSPAETSAAVGVVYRGNRNVWHTQRWANWEHVIYPYERDLSAYDDVAKYPNQPVQVWIRPQFHMGEGRSLKILDGMRKLGFVKISRDMYERNPKKAAEQLQRKKQVRKLAEYQRKLLLLKQREIVEDLGCADQSDTSRALSCPAVTPGEFYYGGGYNDTCCCSCCSSCGCGGCGVPSPVVQPVDLTYATAPTSIYVHHQHHHSGIPPMELLLPLLPQFTPIPAAEATAAAAPFLQFPPVPVPVPVPPLLLVPGGTTSSLVFSEVPCQDHHHLTNN